VSAPSASSTGKLVAAVNRPRRSLPRAAIRSLLAGTARISTKIERTGPDRDHCAARFCFNERNRLNEEPSDRVAGVHVSDATRVKCAMRVRAQAAEEPAARWNGLGSPKGNHKATERGFKVNTRGENPVNYCIYWSQRPDLNR
jgi:hypothetical protein